MVVVFLLTGTVHIGLLKLLIENEEQEWWGRLGGFLLLAAIGWTALFGLAFYVPLLFAIGPESQGTQIAGGLGGISAPTLFGKQLGNFWNRLRGFLEKGASTSDDGKSPVQLGLEPAVKLVIWATPYIFALYLMVSLSLGVYWLAGRKLNGVVPNLPEPSQPAAIANPIVISMQPRDADPKSEKGLATESSLSASSTGSMALMGNLPLTGPAIRAQRSNDYWKWVKKYNPPWLWICWLILALAALVLAFRVDINVFSMNLLYRNRLVRCYLGASRSENQRHANPFTGFDPADDLLLAELRSESKYRGPYPIVCAALNVTHGERLGWRERKVESFFFHSALLWI